MYAHINQDGCIGCGFCAQTCPTVFEMRQNGIAQVIVAPIPLTHLDSAMHARTQCPANVISIDSTACI